MTAPVTEPLVDAKDEARTDIASALLKIHEDRMFFVNWMVGVGAGIGMLMFAAAGLVIAVLS